ncbi:MAG: hypothetical protein A3J24_09205 [Deltaproteobacteria bacterium RIFCSPLOWO2_02_FULL_53_8]|nr:MAG: hypothetical protein A3J24_09205 [Deltaproteobacteria bacterium RIFCSPLOWO2_02_FULL_53_8]
MRRLAAAAFVVIMLSGCAPMVTVWPVEAEKAQVFDVFQYEGLQERMVGEPVFQYRLSVKTRPGFAATENFQPEPDTNHSPSGLPVPEIKAGSEWVAFGRLRLPDGEGYVCANVSDAPRIVMSPTLAWEFCLLVDKEGAAYGTAFCDDEYSTWLREHDSHGSIKKLKYGTKTDKYAGLYGAKGTIFVQIWNEKPPKGLFKPKKIYVGKVLTGRAIIYVGKAGSVLRFISREWMQQDMELTFDLNESKIVGISGVQFEVLDATNSSIKFKIITPPQRIKEMMDEQEQKLNSGDEEVRGI